MSDEVLVSREGMERFDLNVELDFRWDVVRLEEVMRDLKSERLCC